MIHSAKGKVVLDGEITDLCVDLDVIFRGFRQSFAEIDGGTNGIDEIMLRVFEKLHDSVREGKERTSL